MQSDHVSGQQSTTARAQGPAFTKDFRRELEQLFQWRRDVRHFLPAPVPTDLRKQLITVANTAPSVGLSQPWRFVSVDDPERRAAVCSNFEACNREALDRHTGERAALYARLKLSGLRDAPWHLATFVIEDPVQGNGLGRQTMPETTTYSAVLAIHTLWLFARAAGLGLGWVSILNPSVVKTVLDVPEGWKLLAYLCVGYPAAESDRPELELQNWEAARPAVWLQR